MPYNNALKCFWDLGLHAWASRSVTTLLTDDLGYVWVAYHSYCVSSAIWKTISTEGFSILQYSILLSVSFWLKLIGYVDKLNDKQRHLVCIANRSHRFIKYEKVCDWLEKICRMKSHERNVLRKLITANWIQKFSFNVLHFWRDFHKTTAAIKRMNWVKGILQAWLW